MLGDFFNFRKPPFLLWASPLARLVLCSNAENEKGFNWGNWWGFRTHNIVVDFVGRIVGLSPVEACCFFLFGQTSVRIRRNNWFALKFWDKFENHQNEPLLSVGCGLSSCGSIRIETAKLMWARQTAAVWKSSSGWALAAGWKCWTSWLSSSVRRLLQKSSVDLGNWGGNECSCNF